MFAICLCKKGLFFSHNTDFPSVKFYESAVYTLSSYPPIEDPSIRLLRATRKRSSTRSGCACTFLSEKADFNAPYKLKSSLAGNRNLDYEIQLTLRPDPAGNFFARDEHVLTTIVGLLLPASTIAFIAYWNIRMTLELQLHSVPLCSAGFSKCQISRC